MSVWVNGHAGAGVDPRDRGLNYGDGAFETMRVRRRGIRLLDHHLERLAETCVRLAIVPPNPELLRRELLRIAAGRASGVLKLLVTRGIGARGYRSSGRERCTRIVSLHALPRGAGRAAADGVLVRMCGVRLGSNPALAGLKTLNRLESVLARAEWRDPRIWDGLMRDGDGNIVCGTRSNVFVRRGAVLLTPRLDRCGIAGVMRRWVLQQAGALGLRAVEARLRWTDLAAADEAFMTNAVTGVVPVAGIRQGAVRLRFASRRTAVLLGVRLEQE